MPRNEKPANWVRFALKEYYQIALTARTVMDLPEIHAYAVNVGSS
jgi:hypothetical protein